MSETTPASVTELTTEQCWDLLAANTYGRLGYYLRGEVRIVPINYRVHDGELVFRTAEDSKFYAITSMEEVAFELDEVSEDSARSVIGLGVARQLTDPAEVAAATDGLRTWVPSEKPRVFAIKMIRISGRAFALDR